MNITETIPFALKALSSPLQREFRIKPNDGSLVARIAEMSNGKIQLGHFEVMELIWTLVARGFVYIDHSQPAPDYWTVCLAEKGRAAVENAGTTPDDPPAYLRRIGEDIPDMSATARLYLEEALRSYASENFLSATMMLGVASEAIFYDTARIFADWLPDGSGPKLKDVLEKKGTAFVHKFSEFQKRLLAHKSAFPQELSQNMDLSMNSLLELYRIARNDVGHPTGISVLKEDCFQHIVVFPLLARRLYGIRQHCRSLQSVQQKTSGSAPSSSADSV